MSRYAARNATASGIRLALLGYGLAIASVIGAVWLAGWLDADQGIGFDSSRLDVKPGLGFVSMRERLRLVQGTIRVQSAPTQGTTLDVWVPAQRQAPQ